MQTRAIVRIQGKQTVISQHYLEIGTKEADSVECHLALNVQPLCSGSFTK